MGLDENYTFSPSGVYRVPHGDLTKVATFNDYTDQLPLAEKPEVFGMHENANIAFQTLEAQKTLTVILDIQPRESGGSGGKKPDELVIEIAAEQLEKLPELLIEDSCHPDTFAKLVNKDGVEGLTNPMGTGLRQEMTRFNALIKAVGKTLKELTKAVRGLVVMTQDLDAMFKALVNNQIPCLWGKVGYPSLKTLVSWYADFVQRVEFFKSWVNNGYPYCYWVSAFFFPQ